MENHENLASVSNNGDDSYAEKPLEFVYKNTDNFPHKTKVCHLFAKYDYCKFENNCKFKHHQIPSVSDFKSRHSYEAKFQKTPEIDFNHQKHLKYSRTSHKYNFTHAKDVNQSVVNHFVVNKKRECRYFKAGICDRGDNCPYQHTCDNAILQEIGDLTINSQIKKKRVPICHYFKKGNCQRGASCKFHHQVQHQFSNIDDAASNISVLGNPTNLEVNTKDTISENEYQKSNCLRESISMPDENSQLLNTMSDVPEQNLQMINILSNISDKSDYEINIKDNNVMCEDDTKVNKDSARNSLYKPSISGSKFYCISSMSEDELCNLRNIEIAQLKKRYFKYIASEDNLTISFTFEPSDPDWPFDLKCLDLQVFFPHSYPLEVCKIKVMPSNNVPEILLRHLNQSVEEWINKRYEDVRLINQVELVFRPFLKWFDKNLEDLFITGLRRVKRDIEAKKSGIEFVPVENLFSSCAKNNTNEIDEVPIVDDVETNIKEEVPQFMPKIQNLETSRKNSSLDNTVLKQGTKVFFNDLELVEGVATISCTKLVITIRCSRCKTSCDVNCVSSRNSTLKCSKCNKVMECMFISSVLHQFSNLVGNLNVVECQIIDLNLVESTFLVDCLNCSKQITVNGLHYGQKQKRWCTFCNEKITFGLEGFKLQATISSYIAKKNIPVKKNEKRKDTLIKEGEPLPDFGTCKHYKKSHRWLRFPCCGKLYPCDVCHDEKENDHEMKFASRMICGFCSKEQPYNKDKPCLSCSGSLTAKGGAHWEGGKGCRNKIKMARDDKHKYAGSCKTTSKKSQNIKIVKKK